jgi:flagellar basal-body rod protein FlgB
MADNSIPLFQVIKRRLSWLSQRQEVLSQNVANADTPDYKPRDLQPFNFRELLKRESMHLNMNASSANHLPGARKRIRDFYSEETHKPFETAPAGNAVVLEEQMAKVSETTLAHRVTTELYKKHLTMIKMAIGKR